MYTGNVRSGRLDTSWITPLLASLFLPLLFFVIMGVGAAFSPAGGAPIAAVVGGLVAALVLRWLDPAMRWPSIALVTFWFVISACVGGFLILVGGTASGLLGMFALQAIRVLWQLIGRRGA